MFVDVQHNMLLVGHRVINVCSMSSHYAGITFSLLLPATSVGVATAVDANTTNRYSPACDAVDCDVEIYRHM